MAVWEGDKTQAATKSLLLLIGWLAGNHEAAVAGFPKICPPPPHLFIQMCADIN